MSERVESRVFFGEIVLLTGVLRFGLTAVAVLLDVASLFFWGGGGVEDVMWVQGRKEALRVSFALTVAAFVEREGRNSSAPEKVFRCFEPLRMMIPGVSELCLYS